MWEFVERVETGCILEELGRWKVGASERRVESQRGGYVKYWAFLFRQLSTFIFGKKIHILLYR